MYMEKNKRKKIKQAVSILGYLSAQYKKVIFSILAIFFCMSEITSKQKLEKSSEVYFYDFYSVCTL